MILKAIACVQHLCSFGAMLFIVNFLFFYCYTNFSIVFESNFRGVKVSGGTASGGRGTTTSDSQEAYTKTRYSGVFFLLSIPKILLTFED